MKNLSEMNTSVDVFLGGTCNNSTWRNELIPLLKNKGITYFNPVVDDWTPECQKIENWHKANDKYSLFVITKEMTGVFSIAELIDLSNKQPTRTIIMFMYDGFDKGQAKSLKATEDLAKSNGAFVCHSYDDIIEVLQTGTLSKQ